MSINPTTGRLSDPPDAAVWRKASKSGTHGNCVEVASNLPGVVAMRDSKNPDGPKLTLDPTSWSRFLAALRQGAFW